MVYRTLQHLDGLCDHRKRRTEVADRLAANTRGSVIVHEPARALVGGQAGLAKQHEELVVESVALVVCAGAGLDTSPDSVPHIANGGGDDAAERLEQAAELIDGLARRIERR